MLTTALLEKYPLYRAGRRGRRSYKKARKPVGTDVLCPHPRSSDNKKNRPSCDGLFFFLLIFNVCNVLC